MDKLTVILVDPPDDEDASVTLRSEKGEVVAFCWPCDLQVGDVIENRLSAALGGNVLATYFSDWPDDKKETLSTEWIERIGHYEYRGRCQVIDQTEGLVEVQGFVIEMDVQSDGHVDFNIARLDLRRSKPCLTILHFPRHEKRQLCAGAAGRGRPVSARSGHVDT